MQAVRLYLIASFDGRRTPAVLRAVAAAAEAGAGAVQVRVKSGGTPDRRELLAATRSVLPPGTLLLVNDDLDAVHAADGAPLADGLHLGRRDAAGLAAATGGEGTGAGLSAARARLGPERLLGASVRDRIELAAALRAGADHAGFGAMAPSPTKSDTAAADPEELRACLAAFPDTPLFPIGGLGPATLERVLATGCRRAAVGGAILDAPDPAAVARRMLAALRA